MNLPNALEDHIPVRPPEICWRPQSCDGILIGIGIIDHDICCVVYLYLRCQVRVDFDMIIHILSFDREKERTEPLKGAKISTNPEKVDFAETGLLLRVVHAIPD